jgi:Pyruvate/2-oxoglutarate dehydrogenase complex, dehydrogenase (E1) component, eukaryotic type, alpha subunit
MHLIDRSVGFEGSTAIVGNTIPIGVGLALSLKLDTKNSISVVYCGDGSVEEGVFYESVNFAVTKKLPVLFVCENNLYSVYSPLKVRQPKNRKIYKMVESIGIQVGYEDGNDVRKVNSLASKAVTHIRDSGSPYFIELSTYRWREHCGPNYDNDIGYRSEDEFLEWKKRDPVKLFKKTLIKEDSRNQKELDRIKNSVQLEVDNAFDFAERSPFPDSKKAFESMFK